MEKIDIEKLKTPGMIVFIVFLVITILSYALNNSIYGENSVFNKTIFGNDALSSAYQHIPNVISTIRILFIAWVLNFATQFVLGRINKGSKQLLTAVKLMKSLLKYVIFIIAILLVLASWGVDTTTLVASAGILSLIIGLGAQSLIADIIAGIFMVFENDFEVGDIVVIDGWRGTVIEIGMRTTKLVDAGGNIKIVNNSKISTVINQTKRLSIAKCYVGVEYGDSLPRVELIIRDNIAAIKDRIPQIVNGPFYKGVDSLGDSSVNLLFMADCKEEDIFIVQRALNREIKIMFDENGISIPFPQVVVNQPVNFEDVDNKKKVAHEAARFADEQSELAKDMEDTQN
ncbi:MAG: mechanosensitive ion channel family protein [archaeon]|nr:mechanosensitive ion channel family protein [archaeon]